MRVVVTGAFGFVGQHTCQALINAGHHVVAVVRRDDGRYRGRPSITVVEAGELAEFKAWPSILAGADAVLHLAGRAHQTSRKAELDEAAFIRANVDVTQRLVYECDMACVGRLIFLSSIAVMGYDSGDTPFTHTDFAPSSAYAITKGDAEKAVMTSSLDWTVLRIPLVYGEGVKANFLSLLNAVQRGIPLPLGRVKNRRHMLYVGNLADALVTLLDCEASVNQVALLADEEPLSSPELIRMMAAYMGKKPRLLPVPTALIRMGAALLRRPMLYHKLCGNLEMDIAPTLALMQWKPPVSQEDGLRHTVEWFNTSA